ncbi:MAG: hypothetical protein NVSMB62_18160 [Acidobacteriaceae bacterium]
MRPFSLTCAITCLAVLSSASLVSGQISQSKNRLELLNQNLPLLDAHNCYPYAGRWNDRIIRALHSGYPVSIEQDLAWYVDPATKVGRVVVSHTPEPSGSEPTLRAYFFEQVRPIIESALATNKPDTWPLIVLHFDFKDNRAELLKAVWQLLGDYEPWLSTAPKTSVPSELQPISKRPILVITEDSDEQQRVFYDDLPIGAKLRLFGSAHTSPTPRLPVPELMHWAVTVSPDELLKEHPTNYRRWWNSSWYSVEEGGQHKAGDWTATDESRLQALVDRAHGLGFWIRFYTLDGFTPGSDKGWGEGYNFGSTEAVKLRWHAAVAAGVNFIATDQYEALVPYLQQNSLEMRDLAAPAHSLR